MRRRLNRNRPVWCRMSDFIPMWLMLNYKNKYGLIFATATVLIGLYAYLKATEGNMPVLRYVNDICKFLQKLTLPLFTGVALHIHDNYPFLGH